MEQNGNSSRTSLSFMVSMILHSSAIALIALGPTFIPGLNGQGDRQSESVEFTVSNNTPADFAPVTVAPAPEVQMPVQETHPLPAPAQVAEVIKPVNVKKVAAKPTAKKTTTSNKLPEKTVADQTSVEPQPIMEASNTEMPVNETVEESPVMIPVQERVEAQPQDIEEVAPVAVAAAPAAAAPVAEKAAEATSAKGAGQDAVQSNSAAGNEVVQVTQNYLGLRQQAGNQPPKYSRDMRLKQMQGRGQLVYYVNKSGGVSDVRVLKSTGLAELDQSAVQAFSKYKFVPGQEGYTLHEFEFSLKGPAESDAGRLRTTYNR